ncbi:hypothetical protein AAES_166246 [Amazona aestiva]|uniref:Cytochrome b-c1 complex subunit 9 n=1 Tax=Amazona aestiva TaxID=12930 RepID=A0A0Q3UPW2_AMAAE|nr:hypothetical protein AAES_166246 [Amazona aestiva]
MALTIAETTIALQPGGKNPQPTATPSNLEMPSASPALGEAGHIAYSVLFRRSSTFALSIILGAVLFERAFDQGADALFEHLNEGKLWKHIKHKYEQSED